MANGESSRPAHRSRQQRQDEASRRDQHRKKRSQARRTAAASDESREERRSRALSSAALAQLNKDNAKRKSKSGGGGGGGGGGAGAARAGKKRDRRAQYEPIDTTPQKTRRQHKSGKKKRVVSGAIMEEGRAQPGLRGGRWSEQSYEKDDHYRSPKKKTKWTMKQILMIAGAGAVVLLIIIIAAVVASKKKKGGSPSSKSSTLGDQDRGKIPANWQNTYLDPFSWATTTDFNVTFTDQMVGNLPVMGLFTTWDDSAKANDKVPALNQAWGSYGSRPARGVNLGGWLSLEPFITPSLFNYDSKLGIIDEWTLCQHLGSQAAKTLEDHYASFITEDTFKAIQDAGLDHVRIPFSYWAVEIYGTDPYVFRTSWRYLLRAIEWARKYGLRVNLDVHGLPGSQNGWNHSGRWGAIGWLNGTDGQLNAKRSLDMHDRLSQFFAQDRYKNVITHYGLANEPRMTLLKTSDVLSWTQSAYQTVRKNGVKALVVFGDGFMGLNNWQGLLSGHSDLVLDVHQYVIFNQNQIDYTHQDKVKYACDGWTQQAQESMDTSRGYGPTIFAEWSQADTDCAQYLTGVGQGNRWEGTFDSGNEDSVLTPHCPTKDKSCSCAKAVEDPSKWSAQYKKFLQMFAEAQMHSFEKGWGWWYWTWKTESSPLWSYEGGLKAGVLPQKAWSRNFNCDTDVPDFAAGGLIETY